MPCELCTVTSGWTDSVKSKGTFETVSVMCVNTVFSQLDKTHPATYTEQNILKCKFSHRYPWISSLPSFKKQQQHTSPPPPPPIPRNIVVPEYVKYTSHSPPTPNPPCNIVVPQNVRPTSSSWCGADPPASEARSSVPRTWPDRGCHLPTPAPLWGKKKGVVPYCITVGKHWITVHRGWWDWVAPPALNKGEACSIKKALILHLVCSLVQKDPTPVITTQGS